MSDPSLPPNPDSGTEPDRAVEPDTPPDAQVLTVTNTKPARGVRGRRLCVRGWPALAAAASLLSLAVGLGGGYWVARHWLAPPSTPSAAGPGTAQQSGAGAQQVKWWTCSMHPQVKLPEPGKCPICFMDLIPLKEDSRGPTGPRRLRMSAAAMALAEIQTTPASRHYATNVVRMVGKVDYDETRLADITAWVPGRLDRLYVDFTGTRVREGDHMVYLYSPELIVAQRELLQVWQRSQRPDNPAAELSAAALRSAEEKLRLLGVLPEQIEEIKRRGAPSDHLTIYAPISGIVIRKHLNEGAYVSTGSKIYTIADLSVVWVYLSAYESDLPWLRYAQEVEFDTEAYPGEVFHGRIAFIDPVLDQTTRTVKVRVSVPNLDGRLKPGMFVRALVRSRLAADGRVYAPELAGKWISPMHPEVIKDAPDKCDVCGMDLVPAEELGFATRPASEPPLVIPATAPLVTGKRAVVYVRLPESEEPVFEGREVVLGPRAGDEYIVRYGLEEGQRVVTKGAFKIDSELQIKGAPSMMSSDADLSLVVPDSFRQRLAVIYEPYLRLQQALADDRLDEARAHWAALADALGKTPPATVEPRLEQAWRSAGGRLGAVLDFDVQQAGAEELRARFEHLAGAMLQVVKTFGHGLDAPLYEAYCPMAFNNRGAAWLQAGEKIDNPYFGLRMRRCGEIRRQFAAEPQGAAR